jgi:translation initiation factor 4E
MMPSIVQEEGEIENPLLAEGPHPLDGTWILWFDGALQSGKRNAPNNWAKNMKRVATFNTVEDFWVSLSKPPFWCASDAIPRVLTQLLSTDRSDCPPPSLVDQKKQGVVNNIPPPSKLPVGSTYHLFREGIMPMWEDFNNAQGGKWTYNEKRDTGVSNKNLDNMWLYTMLCLVGENFADADEVRLISLMTESR